MTEPIKIFTVELSRESFPDEETYQKALASSKQRKFVAEDDEIDITGLDKTAVLIALYKPARQVGMGLLDSGLTDNEIRDYVTNYQKKFGGQFPYVDYLGGKPLKVNLSGDTFNGRLYNRDQGVGAARRVVEELRDRALGGRDLA